MNRNRLTQPLLALSVETSGRTGSAAVGIGGQVIAEISFSGQMRHSTELFPAVAGLLYQTGNQANDVQHIYISAGPGSFMIALIDALYTITPESLQTDCRIQHDLL